MWFPMLRGELDRRILVNYRLDPERMQECLPEPFRPKIVNGYGMAGVCLIRMNRIRPRFLPFGVVRSSENGALRFAVEWEQDGKHHEGVYIPSRYTTSRLAYLAGARMFPGRHYMASFKVEETSDHFRIQLDSNDLQMKVSARRTGELNGSEVFSNVDEASKYFEDGANGYSESLRSGQFDGVELRILDWKVTPLTVEEVSCNYFEDAERFPPGTAAFDNALLMRGLKNEFHSLRSFCCMLPAKEQPQAEAHSGAAGKA